MKALVYITVGDKMIAKGEEINKRDFTASQIGSMIDRGLIDGEIVELEYKEEIKEIEFKEIEVQKESLDVEKLREQFKAKFDKEVPNNKKNNSEWILEKLNS